MLLKCLFLLIMWRTALLQEPPTEEAALLPAMANGVAAGGPPDGSLVAQLTPPAGQAQPLLVQAPLQENANTGTNAESPLSLQLSGSTGPSQPLLEQASSQENADARMESPLDPSSMSGSADQAPPLLTQAPSQENIEVDVQRQLDPSNLQTSGATSQALPPFEQRDVAVHQPLGVSAPACTSVGCNGCLLPLGDNAHHLDWLDNNKNGEYCSPKELADKTHVFVLSSGIDPTHPTLQNRLHYRQDCSNASPAQPWTASEDKHGMGTMLASLIAGEQLGVTPNAVIHSVKVTNDNNEDGGSQEYLRCGLQQVKGWMDANPTQLAIVLVGVPVSSLAYGVELQNILMMTTRAVVIATTKSPSCFSFMNSIPRVLSPGATDSTLQYQSGGTCANVMAASVGVNAATINGGFSRDVDGELGAGAVIAGVLAQYAAQNPAMDAIQLADAILTANSDGDLVTLVPVPSVPGMPPASTTVPTKLIRYLPPGGCRPCDNGGSCVPTNEHPTSQCQCPASIVGEHCEKMPGDAARFLADGARAEVSNCVALTTSSPTGGSFKYPPSGLYSNFIDCTWSISVDPSFRFIEITVQSTDIETTFDGFLILSPTFQQLNRFDDHVLTVNGRVFTYPYNSLILQFYSDNSVTYNGFRVTYQGVTRCQPAISSNGTFGTFRYPINGSIAADRDCTWSIAVDRCYSAIELTLLSTNIGSQDVFRNHLFLILSPALVELAQYHVVSNVSSVTTYPFNSLILQYHILNPGQVFSFSLTYRAVPVPAAWAAWTDWGPCSVTCGRGTQTRKRCCVNPCSPTAAAECPASNPASVDQRLCNNCAAGCERSCSSHPTFCDQYVMCLNSQSVAIACKKEAGHQLYFDVVDKTCKRYCNATLQDGCRLGVQPSC